MENISFNHLPLEIVEQILINVPTHCISFNLSWVCKLWTNIILKSDFWIRKLMKNKIILIEDTQSVLREFDMKIQVACLYNACLYEEHVSLKMPLNSIKLNKLIGALPSIGALGYTWQISDDIEEMLMSSGVLITRSVSHVDLSLQKGNLPALPLLLKLLAIRNSTVTIYDDYSFWNLSPRCEYMQLLKGQAANVCSLRGCVSSLKGLLGKDAHDLQLSIAVDENNTAINPGLSTTENRIMMLHIKAGTDVSNLNGIKTNGSVLIVSGLESTHILWMTSTVKMLFTHPCELMLLSYNLNNKDSRELLKSLADANVEPTNIMCSSSTINGEDVKELQEFAVEFWPQVSGWFGDWFDLYESNEELMDHRMFDEIFCEHD